MRPARQIIITADDFGAAETVNAAVEAAHTNGVLSAASLMVGESATADAVERAKRLPGLRVGLHLVLTDGRPVLARSKVSHLVDDDGKFDTRMALAGARMFLHPSARAELAAEIEAQFAAFAATGLKLDHVNAHKHFHLHPTIAGLILRLGPRFGVRAVRFPVEPLAPLRAVESGKVNVWQATSGIASLMRHRFRRAGWLAPDQVFGLRWSGAMTAHRLKSLICALPPGLSEIYLHPATADEFDGSAAGYGYREELAALTDPGVRTALAECAGVVGGFADFPAVNGHE